jgi:transcriptional regulator with XRE-family HTH domain
MTAKSPSLRQIAQELGVSHSLLSLWRQGKRTLKSEVEAKYWAFVTTILTFEASGGGDTSEIIDLNVKSTDSDVNDTTSVPISK